MSINSGIMKKRLKSVRYIGIAVLAIIAWFVFPHVSHGCLKKNCVIFSFVRHMDKEFIAKEPIEPVLSRTCDKLFVSVNQGDENEYGEDLFKITLTQARAPPRMI